MNNKHFTAYYFLTILTSERKLILCPKHWYYTTKNVAQVIANKLDADIAELHAKHPYTSADLDWHDPQSRISIEQHQHNSRVEINDDLPDISNYNNVIIGHPIWWGIPPCLITTAIDKLDLNGKNLTSFATSGGSGYKRSQANIERTLRKNNYNVTITQGAVLNNQHQIETWVKTFNFR